MPDFTGHYAFDTFAFEVLALEDGLGVRMFGAPEGFEIPLAPTDDPLTFVLQGGPAPGAPGTFQMEGDRVTGVDVAGQLTLERLDGPPELPEPHGQGLFAPDVEFDDAKRATFDQILSEVDQGTGREIDWSFPYPKHEFLQYAAGLDRYIFHGSGDLDIEEFVPRRSSTESFDRSGRGNVMGIYGTHDGLWPMFFSVIDRSRIDGSIRNGFTTLHGSDGAEARMYNFSVTRENLPGRPFREGMLYLLPRTTFTQLAMMPGGPLTNEWASEEPLRPLARLRLVPEDFPFLEQIGGHDDGPVLELQQLSTEIYDAVATASEVEGGYAMRLGWTDDLAATFVRWAPMMRLFFPGVRLVLRLETNDEVWLDYFGQPATNEMLGQGLRRRGVLD
jgi:hypothetical protein